jgi:hypothetical protein
MNRGFSNRSLYLCGWRYRLPRGHFGEQHPEIKRRVSGAGSG